MYNFYVYNFYLELTYIVKKFTSSIKIVLFLNLQLIGLWLLKWVNRPINVILKPTDNFQIFMLNKKHVFNYCWQLKMFTAYL